MIQNLNNKDLTIEDLEVDCVKGREKQVQVGGNELSMSWGQKEGQYE